MRKADIINRLKDITSGEKDEYSEYKANNRILEICLLLVVACSVIFFLVRFINAEHICMVNQKDVKKESKNMYVIGSSRLYKSKINDVIITVRDDDL